MVQEIFQSSLLWVGGFIIFAQIMTMAKVDADSVPDWFAITYTLTALFALMVAFITAFMLVWGL